MGARKWVVGVVSGLALLSAASGASGVVAQVAESVSAEECVADLLAQISAANVGRGVRVFSPAEVMALSGLNPLTMHRTSRTWIIVAPVESAGSFLWYRVSAGESGLVVERGFFCPSRLGRIRAIAAHELGRLKLGRSDRISWAAAFLPVDPMVGFQLGKGF